MIAYDATRKENRNGTTDNPVEIAADKPLPVDGTVFDPRPEPEGLFGDEVDGVVPGDAAVSISKFCASISSKNIYLFIPILMEPKIFNAKIKLGI